MFNVADVALMVGVGLVLVLTWFGERGEAKQALEAEAPRATE